MINPPHSSIKSRKSKTKVITTAGQKKGKYHKEPMRTQRKTKQTAQSAGKRGKTQAIKSRLVQVLRELSGPITEGGEATPIKTIVIQYYFRQSFESGSKN